MSSDIQVLSDIGSDRRLWSQIGHGVHKLFMRVLQLPPSSAADGDVAWCAEIDALRADFRHLAGHMGSSVLSNTSLMGDWNFQPDELSGGKELRRKRQQCWEEVRDARRLKLHNSLMNGPYYNVHFDRHNRSDMIRTGSTRHGPGESRGIDLIAATFDVGLTLTMHNRLHCGGGQVCGMQRCHEFAGGNHFLQTAEVRNVQLIRSGESASPNFPMAWRSEERWKRALSRCEPAMYSLANALTTYGEQSVECGPQSRFEEQWLADASAWLLNTVAHVARDACLDQQFFKTNTPPSVQELQQDVQDNEISLLDTGSCSLDPFLVQHILRKHANLVTKPMLQTCFR